MALPTKEEMNKLCALTCGWTFHSDFKNGQVEFESWVRPDGRITEGVPRYCSDRNTLPDILAAVQSASAVDNWWAHVSRLMNDGRGTPWYVIDILQADQRLHVEAALRALERWKPEWDESEGESNG